MDEWVTEAMTGMMEKVVNEGTGTLLKTSAYQVAGKTGSAEADSDGTTHAWFVGFAPSNHPKLVVSIVVEGAEPWKIRGSDCEKDVSGVPFKIMVSIAFMVE